MDAFENGLGSHLLGSFFRSTRTAPYNDIGEPDLGDEICLIVRVVDRGCAVSLEKDLDTALFTKVNELAFEIILAHLALRLGYSSVIGNMAQRKLADASHTSVEVYGSDERLESIARDMTDCQILT